MLPILTLGLGLLGLRHASLLVLNVLVSLLPLSLGMYFDTVQKSCTSTFQASYSCMYLLNFCPKLTFASHPCVIEKETSFKLY